MIEVSDPQPLYEVDSVTVRKHLAVLRSKGLDVHEFATQYVNRTVELGYPPKLELSARGFIAEKATA